MYHIYEGFVLAGLVLTFNGVVQLCVRKKTGPWKEGGAILLAGAIIAGMSVLFRGRLGVMWLWIGHGWFFIIVGLVLACNGVMQLCVRKKTGPWKEGGAILLAGAIIVFLAWLAWGKWIGIYVLFTGFIIAGLVLAFNGVVQLCVRKKTGLWREGGAILLAGAIITVVLALRESLGVTTMPMYDFSYYIRGGSVIAGPILALNGVVQLCVRKKTGPWKEGGASLLAGIIVMGVLYVAIVLGWL